MYSIHSGFQNDEIKITYKCSGKEWFSILDHGTKPHKQNLVNMIIRLKIPKMKKVHIYETEKYVKPF